MVSQHPKAPRQGDGKFGTPKWTRLELPQARHGATMTPSVAGVHHLTWCLRYNLYRRIISVRESVSMRLFAHILLATMVFISQMSFGSVVCLCPERPNTPTSKSVESAATCPVTGEKNCTCCQGEKTSSDKNSDTVTSKASNCQVSAAQTPETDKCSALTVTDAPVAALPNGVTVPSAGSKVLPRRPTYLVVPRIRPPDIGANGLRAPPPR